MDTEDLVPSPLGFWGIVSLVLHPLLTPTPAGILILWLAGLSLSTAVWWISICAVTVVLPIGAYIGIMKSVWGRDTGIRENRHQLYVLGVLLTILLVLVLRERGAPALLLASIYAGVLSGVIGAVVNLSTKVSLHVGVSTGISLVFYSVAPVAGLLAGFLTIIVGIARLRLGNHSPLQLVVAAMIPSFSIVVVFFWMGISLA